MSAKFENGQDGDGITNVIKIRAGKYKHGQLDKDALGSGKGLIQSDI